jgi:hypothetical protein
MNRKSTIIAGFLAASAVCFGIAQAKGPDCSGDGKPGYRQSSMQQGGSFDPSARVEQRLSRLKGDLKLNAQQEPLWAAFAEKSQAEAAKGVKAMRERIQDDKPLTAPERLTQMQSLMKDRVAAMESVNESFTRLYAALTPEQKAAADKHFSAAGKFARDHGHRGPWRDGQAAPIAPEARKG